MQLICKVCKCIIVNDVETIKNDKYIQCPTCFRMMDNIFYEGEDGSESS